MKSKSIISIVILISFIAWSACAKEPITFVVHGSTGAIEAYKALFEQFRQETGIAVEVIYSNTAINTKWERIIAMTAGGVSPDIVSGVSTEFGEYAYAGLLEPLDMYIDRDGLNRNELIPTFTNALQINGQQYILPYGSSAFVMTYNRTHLSEAGLTLPPTQWANAKWSWQEYVTMATKLTVTQGNQTTRWGVAGFPHWSYVPYAFGGSWVSSDLQRFNGTDQATIAALENLQDLAHGRKALNPSGTQDDFLAERGSTAMVGTWLLPRLAESKIAWNFMPWFQYESQQPAGVIFPIGYGILSNSTRKEEAWTLIKWLTWNRDANFAYAQAAGAVPSLQANIPRWVREQQSLFGNDINVQVVAEQVQFYSAIVEVRKSPAFSKIDPILTNAVNSIYRNLESARVSMEKVAGQINQLLQDTSK
jgi:multiple sugar transport system substrate-binding protein